MQGSHEPLQLIFLPRRTLKDDYFTVIFNADIEQVNGDPDKGDTWL